MNQNQQIEINLDAEKKVLEAFPYRNLKTAFRESGRYSEIINYARLLGMGCVKCSGKITEPNLAFFGYNPSTVKCRLCQDEKALIIKLA